MADALAEQVVDAINDIAGAHAGHRAAHARGSLCAGRFAATPEAQRLTRAAHMQGEPVRATVRFSNGGGDPRIPDYATEGRGMAVKLYLDDGARTDMVALSLPVFFVRTPEDFLDFTRARKPDPQTGQPDPREDRRLVRRAPGGGTRDPGCRRGAAARQLRRMHLPRHTFVSLGERGG